MQKHTLIFAEALARQRQASCMILMLDQKLGCQLQNELWQTDVSQTGTSKSQASLGDAVSA